jgi:hypothetical protein
MARRAGLWALGGASAATGVLVASPEAYAWLRRRVGLEDAEIAGEPVSIDDDAAESSFDTREARLSLRARLNEAEAEAQSDAPTAIITPDELVEEPAPQVVRELAEVPAEILDDTVDETEVEPPAIAERPLAARPRPARAEVEPMRRAVDEARARMLDNARNAARENGPAA